MTDVGSDFRPFSVVPSVTAYEKVADPVAPGCTRRARRWSSSVTDTVPNAGSSPVIDAGSIVRTSSFGSWSFMSTGSEARAPARTPNASGSAIGGLGSSTTCSCSSLGTASGSVRSSRLQSWLDGISAPSGTDQAHPERVSLRMTAESLETNTGRCWSPIVSSP